MMVSYEEEFLKKKQIINKGLFTKVKTLIIQPIKNEEVIKQQPVCQKESESKTKGFVNKIKRIFS